jgi:hypothetical protein
LGVPRESAQGHQLPLRSPARRISSAEFVYSFVRIGAALGITVEDVFTRNRRLWVRLRVKGGERHAMPCHHNLENTSLDAITPTVPRNADLAE